MRVIQLHSALPLCGILVAFMPHSFNMSNVGDTILYRLHDQTVRSVSNNMSCLPFDTISDVVGMVGIVVP